MGILQLGACRGGRARPLICLKAKYLSSFRPCDDQSQVFFFALM